MVNTLALSSMVALAFYWAGGFSIGSPYVSAAVSFFLLLTGGSTLARYAGATYSVVVRGARNADDDGHLAVYGIFLLALGSVYAGAFNLVWLVNSEPMSWLGTPQSNFGRFLMASGFALLFRSPDEVRKRILVPSLVWLAAVVAIAITAAFFFGTQFANITGGDPSPALRSSLWHEDRPRCPDDRQVWGATGGNTFHMPDSPYRSLVVPARCFETEQEARAAGYVAPGSE